MQCKTVYSKETLRYYTTQCKQYNGYRTYRTNIHFGCPFDNDVSPAIVYSTFSMTTRLSSHSNRSLENILCRCHRSVIHCHRRRRCMYIQVMALSQRVRQRREQNTRGLNAY